jgi:hypothetical protein
MNFRFGLKRYWKGKVKLLLCLVSLQFFLFVENMRAEESICAEGILFKAEVQCSIVAHERRMKVPIRSQLVLLPDSLLCISEKYPAFLWIEENIGWKDLVGKHVRVTGTVREFISGEFLIHAEHIFECQPNPKERQLQRNLTEEEVNYWEEQIPLMAGAAFYQEGLRVLFNGFDVVQSHDSALWVVHPDGTETFIKEIPPPVQVEVGRVFNIAP